MNNWVVKYSDRALSDISEISEYIELQLGAPKAAGELTRQFFESFDGLDTMPLRFRAYDKEKGLYKFPIENYVGLFQANRDSEKVSILRVFYGGRDIDNQPLE